MRYHRSKNIVAVNGLYICAKCNESFTTESEYVNHRRKPHRKSRNCDTCDATFSNIVFLNQHMIEIHGEVRPLMQCDICQVTYYCKRTIERHMKKHIKMFMCDLCGKKFATDAELQRHCLVHDNEDDIPAKNSRHLKCPLCTNTYRRSYVLLTHMKSKHPINGLKKYDELSLLMCKKCNKMFPTIEARESHLETHNKVICQICYQKFNTQESLTYHEKTHSTKDRPYACHLCENTYVQKSHLNTHIGMKHSSLRPHSCQLCTKTFFVKYELTAHIRHVHSKTRPFGCDQCDRAFKRATDLRTHKQTHLGIYRYQCEICDKNFRVSSKLLAHNTEMHPHLLH